MGYEPSEKTRTRTAMPSLWAIARWTDPLWKSAPSPADLRRSVVESRVFVNRTRVVAAALSATAAVSATGPALAGAQDAGATPAAGEAVDPWPTATEGRPMLSKKSKALSRKAKTKRAEATADVASKRTKRVSRHRMVHGQSLWWLARKRLGPKASNAAVYRYVVKVWNANEDRIGTGNPDLIKTGTVVTLPTTEQT